MSLSFSVQNFQGFLKETITHVPQSTCKHLVHGNPTIHLSTVCSVIAKTLWQGSWQILINLPANWNVSFVSISTQQIWNEKKKARLQRLLGMLLEFGGSVKVIFKNICGVCVINMLFTCFYTELHRFSSQYAWRPICTVPIPSYYSQLSVHRLQL